MASGLPWLIRLAVVLAVWAAGLPMVLRYVLLRGPRAVRALEWRDTTDGFVIFLGPAMQPMAVAAVACRRYGTSLWLLSFRSTEGVFPAFVDVRLQDSHSIRRLGCRLSKVTGVADPDARQRQAVTIPSKV